MAADNLVVGTVVLDALEAALGDLEPVELFSTVARRLQELPDEDRDRQTLMLLSTVYTLGMRYGAQLAGCNVEGVS